MSQPVPDRTDRDAPDAAAVTGRAADLVVRRAPDRRKYRLAGAPEADVLELELPMA